MHISCTVKYADNRKGYRLGSVDDQVVVDAVKPERLVSKIMAKMSDTGDIRSALHCISKLAQNAGCNFAIAFFRQVVPNFDQVGFGNG